VTRPDLHLLLLTEPTKPELALLLRANSQAKATLLMQATHFALQEKDPDFVSQVAKQRLALLLAALRDLFRSAKL
jgi:hypothetical protein